jgi:hypothetical protein
MARLIVDGPDLVVGLSWLENSAPSTGTSASRYGSSAPSRPNRGLGTRCAGSG